eukprot:1901510-Pleurochrysis_carterae.AAC.7
MPRAARMRSLPWRLNSKRGSSDTKRSSKRATSAAATTGQRRERRHRRDHESGAGARAHAVDMQ